MYINLVNVQNKNLYISYWLLLITILVAIMIVVGGLTRLTDSGLSITKWDLFAGIIPPLNLEQWQSTFFLYKGIPEFKLLNSSMTLDEFKYIFWWEYAHRLLGRLIGIVYILPLLFFTYKRYIDKKNILILYSIFLLIFLQGIIGWYMVKSGLVLRVDVSHYRLSVHLFVAFVIYILLLWNFFKFLNFKNQIYYKKIPYNLPIILIFFLLLQIVLGAFVSGLDAGKIYQTWPLMNNNFFPDDSSISQFFSIEIFNSPSLVQFLHRNIAYFIILLFIFIFFIVNLDKEYIQFRKTVFYIFIALSFQVLLGILTIISGAQIFLASMHQMGSIILITFSIVLVYQNSKA